MGLASDLKSLLGRKRLELRSHFFGKQIFPEFLVEHAPISLGNPISQACTAGQMDEDAYHQWCQQMELCPLYNRKVWEFCFILQALANVGVLKPGHRGLGFGVGKEPLPSVMASAGCHVVATDLDIETASLAGWVDGSQHAAALDDLFFSNLVGKTEFYEQVEHQYCDMNDISDKLSGFDFCWSSCAFEHLGSIEKGLAFVEASLRTLKPGGIAVHTTEFNCSSDTDTISTGGTVLFRRQDIEKLASRLTESGHFIETSYFVGDSEIDHYIDTPPYRNDKHLKIALGAFLTTSYGVIVRKGS